LTYVVSDYEIMSVLLYDLNKKNSRK